MEYRVEDIPVYYQERGEGRPLPMLHGSYADHREMMHKMEPLFEERTGWRRIYPDLPGRGTTPGADWISSQDDILEVMLAFLDGIAPGERFVVAGHSLGGYLARGIVYRRGERIDGVMLNAPAVEMDLTKRNYPPHQVLVHDSEFVAGVGTDEQVLLQVAVVQNRQRLIDFRAGAKPGLALADREFIGWIMAKGGFSFDVDNPAEPFPAPTLIVTGRQAGLDMWLS